MTENNVEKKTVKDAALLLPESCRKSFITAFKSTCRVDKYNGELHFYLKDIFDSLVVNVKYRRSLICHVDKIREICEKATSYPLW